jgi:RNA-dependent RNA polymerase
MKQALEDFNIDIISVPKFIPVAPREAALWSMIDSTQSQNPSADLQDLTGNEIFILPFEVRYQLEVCISREFFNEHNIEEEFVRKLANIATQDPAKARDILEYVAAVAKRVYDPMTIFENQEALSFSAKTDIPHYCSYTRKATITPTTIYFSSPTVETTNRVIRHYYKENREGRFLRVQFTDELFEVCCVQIELSQILTIEGPHQFFCYETS